MSGPPTPEEAARAGYSMGGDGFVVGRAEYHVRWGVRRYDLTNLRTDLDHCSESGRSFIIWASVLLGVGATLLVSWLVAIAQNPLPRLSLRLTLGYGTILFVVLGLALVALDRRFSTKASVDLGYIKGKVDNLISMFDEENP